MSTYAKSLALVTVTGLSGSLLYYCYNNSKNKELKELKEKKISFENLEKVVNPGLLFGTLIGCYFSYNGKPVLSSLFK